MDGVDLADMRRLHCNSTIVMGQNRWWLKLFFNLLDVGTSNALVLFNESKKIHKEKTLNIVQFKMKLVEDLVGRNIDILFEGGGQVEQHTPVHIEGGVQLQCAYCALMSRMRRTRYQCAGCGVPLCSIGNGKVQDKCFKTAHETEERLEMVCKKHAAMKKRNRRQKQN
jgi:hypothetical protein